MVQRAVWFQVGHAGFIHNSVIKLLQIDDPAGDPFTWILHLMKIAEGMMVGNHWELSADQIMLIIVKSSCDRKGLLFHNWISDLGW